MSKRPPPSDDSENQESQPHAYDTEPGSTKPNPSRPSKSRRKRKPWEPKALPVTFKGLEGIEQYLHGYGMHEKRWYNPHDKPKRTPRRKKGVQPDGSSSTPDTDTNRRSSGRKGNSTEYSRCADSSLRTSRRKNSEQSTSTPWPDSSSARRNRPIPRTLATTSTQRHMDESGTPSTATGFLHLSPTSGPHPSVSLLPNSSSHLQTAALPHESSSFPSSQPTLAHGAAINSSLMPYPIYPQPYGHRDFHSQLPINSEVSLGDLSSIGFNAKPPIGNISFIREAQPIVSGGRPEHVVPFPVPGIPLDSTSAYHPTLRQVSNEGNADAQTRRQPPYISLTPALDAHNHVVPGISGKRPPSGAYNAAEVALSSGISSSMGKYSNCRENSPILDPSLDWSSENPSVPVEINLHTSYPCTDLYSTHPQYPMYDSQPHNTGAYLPTNADYAPSSSYSTPSHSSASSTSMGSYYSHPNASQRRTSSASPSSMYEDWIIPGENGVAYTLDSHGATSTNAEVQMWNPSGMYPWEWPGHQDTLQ